MADVRQLQYPIGEFQYRQVSPSERGLIIRTYGTLPDQLESAVTGLIDSQLDTPYRPGGWTVRQVVHHLPESHMNAYVRFKRALTESEPKAVVVDEAAWAELDDSRIGRIAPSLELFRILQQRWKLAIEVLEPSDFERTLWHPAWGTVSVDYLVQSYAWHGRHHLAQITTLRERMDW